METLNRLNKKTQALVIGVADFHQTPQREGDWGDSFLEIKDSAAPHRPNPPIQPAYPRRGSSEELIPEQPN